MTATADQTINRIREASVAARPDRIAVLDSLHELALAEAAGRGGIDYDRVAALLRDVDLKPEDFGPMVEGARELARLAETRERLSDKVAELEARRAALEELQAERERVVEEFNAKIDAARAEVEELDQFAQTAAQTDGRIFRLGRPSTVDLLDPLLKKASTLDKQWRDEGRECDALRADVYEMEDRLRELGKKPDGEEKSLAQRELSEGRRQLSLAEGRYKATLAEHKATLEEIERLREMGTAEAAAMVLPTRNEDGQGDT